MNGLIPDFKKQCTVVVPLIGVSASLACEPYIDLDDLSTPVICICSHTVPSSLDKTANPAQNLEFDFKKILKKRL